MKLPIIIGVVVLVLGGVLAAAFFGVITIPGITPAKKKSGAAALYQEGEAPADSSGVAAASPDHVEDEAAKTPAQKKPDPDFDPLTGQKKLAKVWNEMDPATLLPIVEKWKDEDLALQLSVMPADKVAPLLASLKPDRASKISKLLQELAAKPTGA